MTLAGDVNNTKSQWYFYKKTDFANTGVNIGRWDSANLYQGKMASKQNFNIVGGY